MEKIEIIGKVHCTSYKCHSYYGNPSYNVVIDEDETNRVFQGYTASNAEIGYGIRNSEFQYTSHKFYCHYTSTGKLVIDYARPLND